jgi:hypothetical protein
MLTKMARRNLRDEAQLAAREIGHELARYRLVDALEKTLDFPQSFFRQGSSEYQAFREPFVKDSGNWLATQLRWQQFWLTAGGRAAISAIISTLLAWPVASVLLVILKWEYVRPRDK